MVRKLLNFYHRCCPHSVKNELLPHTDSETILNKPNAIFPSTAMVLTVLLFTENISLNSLAPGLAQLWQSGGAGYVPNNNKFQISMSANHKVYFSLMPWGSIAMRFY